MFFICHCVDLPDDFICDKRDQTSYMWQELELASELESDL